MIRIVRKKQIIEDYKGNKKEAMVYFAILGDGILATQVIELKGLNDHIADTMAKQRLGAVLLKTIEVEDITDEEYKTIIEKDKLNNIHKDFE